MQRGFSGLTIILVLLAFLFAIITQRMVIVEEKSTEYYSDLVSQAMSRAKNFGNREKLQDFKKAPITNGLDWMKNVSKWNIPGYVAPEHFKPTSTRNEMELDTLENDLEHIVTPAEIATQPQISAAESSDSRKGYTAAGHTEISSISSESFVEPAGSDYGQPRVGFGKGGGRGRGRGGRGRGGRGGRLGRGGWERERMSEQSDRNKEQQRVIDRGPPIVDRAAVLGADHSVMLPPGSETHDSMHSADGIPSHPFYSPRAGTDISVEHQMGLLRCPNQSKCIVPELQLNPVYKVYFCRHPVRQGVRFYFLVREGLLLHPNVVLLPQDKIHEADFVVYLPGSAPWHRTECNSSSLASKLIVLDEFDGHTFFMPYGQNKEMSKYYSRHKDFTTTVVFDWYFMYFKRSFVVRKNGLFLYYPHLERPDVYGITYSLAEAYLRPKFNVKREMEIVCTLRGSKNQPARLRVQEWLEEYVKVNRIERAIVGQLNTASRTEVNRKYFDLMHNAQIIVTVNPSDWEGDFRLWEALASGALIMVDPIFAPHPFPLEHGKHVVFFSNSNKTDLWEKLNYYRSNPEEARKVAYGGYLHAMKHHRTVSMLDYVLRSAHIKLAKQLGQPVPKYKFSGQYLHTETVRQQKNIETMKVPGLYSYEH